MIGDAAIPQMSLKKDKNDVARPRWLLPTPPRTDEFQREAIDVGDFELRQMTLCLMRGENLSRAEAGKFLGALLNLAATDAQVAAALAVLAVKGETVEELAGMAEAMRNRAIPVRCHHERFIDTAGTGSSAAKTFNVSTAAAFVIAGAGLPVAKHGSRAATSHSGSADVLEALGVNTGAPPETVERCLNEHGICFMFAPLFHGATARVAHVRRELGVHTTFNLLGPLTNPARAPFQILGVWHRSLLEPVASVLALLGAEKAWVVHGADGLDEITLTRETFVAACSTGSHVETFTISPHDFGLERRSLDEARGSGSAENARLIRAILQGKAKENFAAARDLVVINAAAALHIAGLASDLRQAAGLARESIESGRAASKLEALIGETNRKE
jgi:anthranilate phosphoribosyltransferase